ncbi:putative transmembrane efflux protein [Actinokineospora spheciospongiae]|uniref:Putative transmembrane efflux protein n=1 Tax=Actinokineospora spheciospongiae TaxID=909613 RepID=W7J6A2_9PSEU|nr:MFS transporter [Actinokineospora spheciospongiae]EWC61579.1 putative transmembrane efflux protein [Actinokineospora spheciospongiae]
MHRAPASVWISDRGRVLTTIASVAFLSSADNSVVSAAAPSVAVEMGLGTAATQGITVAYMLPFAGLLLAAGPVVDRYGERAMLRLGLFAFTVGTLLAGSARSFELLLAGRVVQGLAAAVLVPATLSLVRTRLAPDDRPKAAATWTVALASALALGPALGGFIAATVHWSWVFWGFLPFLLFSWLIVPPPGPRSVAKGADPLSTALAAAAMLAVTGALLVIADAPGWAAPLALTAALAAVAFAMRDRRSARPVLPRQLIANPVFRTALIIQSLWGLGVTGVTVVTPLVHQRWLGLDPATAALPLVAVAFALVFTAPFVPRVLARFGPSRTVGGGMLVVALGLVLVAVVNGSPAVLPRLPGLVLIGFGSAFTVPLTTTALDVVEDRVAGVASGVLSAAREFAGALGVALTAALMGGGVADGEALADGYTRTLLAAAALQVVAVLLSPKLTPYLSPRHKTNSGSAQVPDRSAPHQSSLR